MFGDLQNMFPSKNLQQNGLQRFGNLSTNTYQSYQRKYLQNKSQDFCISNQVIIILFFIFIILFFYFLFYFSFFYFLFFIFIFLFFIFLFFFHLRYIHRYIHSLWNNAIVWYTWLRDMQLSWRLCKHRFLQAKQRSLIRCGAANLLLRNRKKCLFEFFSNSSQQKFDSLFSFLCGRYFLFFWCFSV